MAFFKSIFSKKKNNSQESTIDEELQEETGYDSRNWRFAWNICKRSYDS